MRLRYNFLLFLLFIVTGVYGHGNAEEISFIVNQGQWADSIRYRADLPGGAMWIRDAGFTYCYTSEEEEQATVTKWESGMTVDSALLRAHWYHVNFKGGNELIAYTGRQKRSWYHNYYHGKDSSNWRGNVPLYGSVSMKGVYEGIDALIYAYGRALKYDFVVHPGAHADQIILAYEGVNPVIALDGSLRITTSVNEVIEERPYAYQLSEGDTIVVHCHYQLTDNELSFVFPQGYDTTQALIIDPELVFVTYSGAGPFSGGYYSFCSTYDNTGGFYTGGVPLRGLWQPNPQWPTTPGAFEEEWTTIYEPMVCINKYDATGSNLLFSTYFGGGGPNDIPHAMVVNEQNELILAGSTGSFNLPVTPGCFDSTKSGGTDMFVAHFTEDGSNLIGATYIGGNLGNSINAIDIYSTSGFTGQNKISPVEITLDAAGNIWAVTNTSTIDFPVTGNAFQPAFGGGNCDGVVFGLTADCTQMLYGSYIGGSNTDVAYSIRLNNEGKLVVCGGTKSNNFPATQNAYKPLPPGSGNWDGYVAVIDPMAGDLLSATYLGTDKDDQVTNIQIDQQGNIYALGRTFGNYPISDGVYALPGTDLFVDKLAPDLSSSLLSTRLGNPQSDTNSFFPTAFLLDNCDHIYVGGLSQYYTRPLIDMPLTEDAFQTNPANFWFGVLNPDFESLLYGTYMGRAQDTLANGSIVNGDHTHVGTYRLDPHGVLYQSICANSLHYPGTTESSWSPYNQNSSITGNDTSVIGQDIVSFKFRFDLSGVDAGTISVSNADTGCAPYTLQFSSNTYAAQAYLWNFGDGTVATEANPVHTFTEEGTYQVMLAIYNDTVVCRNHDTTYKTITIYNPQVPELTLNDTLVCDYTLQLPIHVVIHNPSPYNQYAWASLNGGGLISSLDGTAMINPNIDTAYVVTVWDTVPGFCGYLIRDTIHIDYKPRVLNVQPADTLVCLGTGVQMYTTGTAGYHYSWTPVTGISMPDEQSPVITPDTTGMYLLTAAYPGCADTSQEIRIRVDDPVVTPFDFQPDSICIGTAIAFYPGMADSTVTGFQWIFGDGSYLELEGNTPLADSIRHAYDRAGTLIAGLTTKTRACPDTTMSDTIYVYAPPLVDLGPDTSLCLDGKPMVLRNLQPPPQEAHHYLWNTGDTTAGTQIVQPGRYQLRVSTEPLGCTTTDEIEVTKDCYTDIPNAFTPNGDGENDYFFPRTQLSKGVTDFRMQILNRWGQMVFETNSIDGRGWDGRFNDQEQPMGVYIYLIEVGYANGRQERYKGNVTLLR